ncbi:MAG: phosphate acyltransferase PlsX [Leptospiraceae bacterium]|nr:phosphate acyltransferase PlsX [Leptospiraceae bacterium]MCP5493654.1 phosphate acyltransferase PlsX [Leptospiraceae bacterium]
MWVAVDVMSGDYGPVELIKGSVYAVNEYGCSVVLVGDEEQISEILLGYEYNSDKIRVLHSTEIIGMDDAPATAVRSMQDSSIVKAVKLVRDRECVGLFSPGNTGATMAAALMFLGRVPGVYRPPIAAPIPQENGTPLLLLDAGANVDCKPEYLAQFAIMGEHYVREIFGIPKPKIGILSNGEEEKKGNSLTTKTYSILKKLPINLVGNIEGRDLYGGGRDVDVVVCDGFVGNVVIKSTEGLAKSIFNILQTQIEHSTIAKTGALMLKSSLQTIKKRLDYAEYGGATLLGVDGVCIIGHGASNSIAAQNAIRVAVESARSEVNVRISESLIKYKIV